MDSRRLRHLTKWADAAHASLIKRGTDFHGGKPDPEVEDIASQSSKLFGTPCLVLDIGGGQGRNALPFLTRGHRVVVTEISKVALDAARRKAAALNVEDKLTTKRVVRFNQSTISGTRTKAHVVICSRVLQNYKPQHRDALVSKMQNKTHPGGFNIIVTHLRHGHTNGAFRNADELKQLYRGWDVTCKVGKVEYGRVGALKLGRLVTLVARKA